MTYKSLYPNGSKMIQENIQEMNDQDFRNLYREAKYKQLALCITYEQRKPPHNRYSDILFANEFNLSVALRDTDIRIINMFITDLKAEP